MRATKIYGQRIVASATLFAEIVIWRVPQPVRGSSHDLKYRMAVVRDEVCVLRFDNEAGKGDHIHRGDVEEPYVFVSQEVLIDDFLNEFERLRREEA